MMRRWIMFFIAASAFGAVDGVVINKTTGKPQAGAQIALVDLRQGMAPVASAKTDAEGKFRIDKDLPGPQLVQATYDGVGYNKMLPPGTPTTGLEIDVYSSTTRPATAKVEQDMILVEPNDTQVLVDEAFLFKNDTQQTYSDNENGTLRFYLPPEAKGDVRVSVTSQGVPVQRPAEKTPIANVYKVKYPVRPGETRFDVTYAMPNTNPTKLAGKVLHDGPVRLIAPPGVKIEGEGLQALGTEPTTQSTVYGVNGKTFTVAVSGTGSLQAASGGGGGGSSDSDNEGPSIQEIKPRIYEKLPWILGLGLGILAISFVLLYSRGSATRLAAPKEKPQ